MRQRSGEAHLNVTIREWGFERILRPQLRAIHTLGLRAGWSGHRIATRIHAVGDYLGLSPTPTDYGQTPRNQNSS